MKTTIERSDSHFEEAKDWANGRSFREVVEEGLRTVIRAKERTKPFRLRDASFGGSRKARPERGANSEASFMRGAANDHGRHEHSGVGFSLTAFYVSARTQPRWTRRPWPEGARILAPAQSWFAPDRAE